MASPTMVDVAARTGMAEKRKGWVKKGLSARQREDLPRRDFALPGKGDGPEGKGSGSYPIPDASHARNALARVAQHGDSSEKKEVRAAVKRKFPKIGTLYSKKA